MQNKIFTLIVALLLTGCSTLNASFTNRISAPSEKDYDYLRQNFELVEKEAEVVLNRHFFAYIPLSGYYNFDDEVAVEKLLRKYNGDLVTNLNIDKKLLFLLYYNRYYVVATGDVWRRKRS